MFTFLIAAILNNYQSKFKKDIDLQKIKKQAAENVLKEFSAKDESNPNNSYQQTYQHRLYVPEVGETGSISFLHLRPEKNRTKKHEKEINDLQEAVTGLRKMKI